jgi:hypothetical protein
MIEALNPESFRGEAEKQRGARAPKAFGASGQARIETKNGRLVQCQPPDLKKK